MIREKIESGKRKGNFSQIEGRNPSLCGWQSTRVGIQECCGISVLGHVQNLPGHGPGQPDLILKLAWLSVGNWNRRPPEVL